MSDFKESLDLVNSSGFLFQIRVAHELDRVVRPGRQLLAQEHRWTDPMSGKEGYIDIILQLGWMRAVIECKRVLNGRWVFLVPTPKRETDKMTLLSVHHEQEKVAVEWWDWKLYPVCHESSFCVVRGQEKERPLLESLAGLVLRSTESVAEEATSLETQNSSLWPTWYLPVIVTNARLEVCLLDPATIDPTGHLPSDGFSTIDVPMVRFRKSLSSRIRRDGRVTDLREANAHGERTVLVMNSDSLNTTLDELSIPKH